MSSQGELTAEEAQQAGVMDAVLRAQGPVPNVNLPVVAELVRAGLLVEEDGKGVRPTRAAVNYDSIGADFGSA